MSNSIPSTAPKRVTERVGTPLPAWQHGEYQVHFIHTGVAESIFHIFPDGTTMLVDCGDHGAITRRELAVPVVPNPSRLAGDWIARYVKRVLPEGTATLNGLPLVDYMLLTHYHDDHCGTAKWQDIYPGGNPLPGCYRSGFALAAEQLAFAKAIDRCGLAAPVDREPPKDCAGELDHMRRTYKALQARDKTAVECFRLGATDQIRPVHGKADGFTVTNITANGRILCRDGHIRDLYADRIKPGAWFNENGMSLGFIVRYGDFTFYAAGDFADRFRDANGQLLLQTEDALADELPRVEVAKADHHGITSMPEKIVAALAPQAFVYPVWDQLHAPDDALDRMASRDLYPDARVLFPTVFTQERLLAAQGRKFLSDIATETLVNGAHVVLTVPPGGATYRISCLDVTSEAMAIKGEYLFTTRK